MSNVVSNAPDLARYEIHVDGELGGMIEYALDDSAGTIEFKHTIVLPSHRGQGLGGELVEHAFADARSAGLKVIPSCPFAASWVREHPEVADLLA